MAVITQTTAFATWLRLLRDRRAKAIIIDRIERVARGLEGDVKSLKGGVSELRVDCGPGYRIYFTRRQRATIILLCGGDKTTQSSDIDNARRLASRL